VYFAHYLKSCFAVKKSGNIIYSQDDQIMCLKVVEKIENCREYLAQVVDERLTRWHKDFNLEGCHEIDTEDFPPKPAVEKFTTAQVWLIEA
jgi:hypothetical protein